MRLIGIDPGLRKTGWGVIECEGSRLSHVANGTVTSDSSLSLAERLLQLHEALRDVVASYDPEQAAVEHTFVNKDPVATLKLGQARAVALLVPAQLGISVHEYAPNQVKKAVVGAGHAGKEQIQAMVGMLLPKCEISGPDAADALAIAICHAHTTGGQDKVAAAILKSQG